MRLISCACVFVQRPVVILFAKKLSLEPFLDNKRVPECLTRCELGLTEPIEFRLLSGPEDPAFFHSFVVAGAVEEANLIPKITAYPIPRLAESYFYSPEIENGQAGSVALSPSHTSVHSSLWSPFSMPGAEGPGSRSLHRDPLAG